VFCASVLPCFCVLPFSKHTREHRSQNSDHLSTGSQSPCSVLLCFRASVFFPSRNTQEHRSPNSDHRSTGSQSPCSVLLCFRASVLPCSYVFRAKKLFFTIFKKSEIGKISLR
jgi:hypothetical protein